jgi:hypothetical protein
MNRANCPHQDENFKWRHRSRPHLTCKVSPPGHWWPPQSVQRVVAPGGQRGDWMWRRGDWGWQRGALKGWLEADWTGTESCPGSARGCPAGCPKRAAVAVPVTDSRPPQPRVTDQWHKHHVKEVRRESLFPQMSASHKCPLAHQNPGNLRKVSVIRPESSMILC